MVKSVLSQPSSSVRLNRNAFDVSYTNKFTSSLGMLLPCYVRECNPDEHYKINPRLFCRSMPMNSAAFIQCKQNVEFFFVPYRLLWSSFPQWFAGTKFDTSSGHPHEERSSFPTMDLGSIFAALTFDASSSSSDSHTDVLGYSLSKGALRLLDLLGYGDATHLKSLTSTTIATWKNVKVSMMRILAYQKVCSDFYRNSSYESSRINAYNVDSLLPHEGSVNFWNYVSNYLQLRYRPWKKDLFNISSPSFQGSDFMSVVTSGVSFPQVISSSTTSVFGNKSDDKSYLAGIANVSDGSHSLNSFSISNLRSAFALDKLYRLQSQAKDGDYKSQIKARFGFDAYAPQYRCDFVGAASSTVQVNPITTTSDTLSSDGSNGTPVGRIYGNGLGVSDNDYFDYDVKEHGILIGISSFVPDVDYSSYGINIFNQKINREDYFQPEFDNLGKQPLTTLCIAPWKLTTLASGQSAFELVNNVLGWFPRYAEYKTCVDEVHGELNGYLSRSFDKAPSLGLWTAPRFNASDDKKLSNWQSNGLTRDFFYIDPSLYDSVFVNQYRGDQSDDQFICEVSNNVQAVLPMSVTGEPLI